MARMIPPKGMMALSVTDPSGRKRQINRDKDGTFHINDPKLAKKLKEEGLGVAGAAGVTSASGYPCKKCGFGSYFKKCSKCGELND